MGEMMNKTQESDIVAARRCIDPAERIGVNLKFVKRYRYNRDIFQK